jgi:leader peptidase (prepilin peptidase)/N-methyltransferase
VDKRRPYPEFLYHDGNCECSRRAVQLSKRQNVYSISRMIRILVTVFAALLGLAFGSFLNVCLSRWPEGESVVKPRSHCRNCGRTLAWWENVPLVSWVALKGRCRGCGSWIGWRYVAVEAAVGGLWAIVVWRAWDTLFPIEWAAGMMLFLWVLVALAVLDAEHLWLPDALTLPGIALGLGWWVLQEEQIEWASRLQNSLLEDARDIGLRLLGVIAAAGLMVLIRWVYWLVRRREGIGLGDAKLMALLAAWLGLPGALLAFGLGVVLGAVVAVVGLAMPKRDADEAWGLGKLPLGTFLCAGGMVSGVWGQEILAAYLRWAGF